MRDWLPHLLIAIAVGATALRPIVLRVIELTSMCKLRLRVEAHEGAEPPLRRGDALEAGLRGRHALMPAVGPLVRLQRGCC